MNNSRTILYSSAAIVLLVLLWGLRQIPAQGRLADQALRESLNQELIVLGSGVRSSTQALKYRLLDVLKAEGNDHATRTFQDSPFLAATLLEWDQVQWKSLWYSHKGSDFQGAELPTWMKDWPLNKLAPDEVYLTKVGESQGQPYFAILVPVRKPNQVAMVGVGIFPAAQFGLNFSADENREVRVFTEQGVALALTHPAYLGASVKNEPLVREILDGDEVSVRHEWKTDHGPRMIGLASRIADSNLYAAIETKAMTASTAAAWAYLMLCAMGAGILNWVFFNWILRALVAQVRQGEETNEQLRRQLLERESAALALAPTVANQAEKSGAISVAIAEALAALTAPSAEILPAAELSTLDFAAIEEGAAPAAEPVEPLSVGMSLQKIVQAALRSMETRLRIGDISVEQFGFENLRVEADPLQLQTALEEILKNAIESMDESPAKNLTLTAREESGQVRIRIEDTGCGVAMPDIDKVFDPFFSTKDSQGVARGLGLNVVRRVVEELSGSVRLTSRLDASGTRVELVLPLAAAHVAASEGGLAPIAMPLLPNAAPTQAETTSSEVIAGPKPVEYSKIKELAFAAAQNWPEIAIRKPKVRSLD